MLWYPSLNSKKNVVEKREYTKSPLPKATSRKLLFFLSPMIADLPIRGTVPDVVLLFLSTYQNFKCLWNEAKENIIISIYSSLHLFPAATKWLPSGAMLMDLTWNEILLEASFLLFFQSHTFTVMSCSAPTCYNIRKLKRVFEYLSKYSQI